MNGLTSSNKRLALLDMLLRPWRIIRRLGLLPSERIDRLDLMNRQIRRWRLVPCQRRLGSDLVAKRTSVAGESGEELEVLFAVPSLEVFGVARVHVD